jgi:tetratricopeptide (TPR) repeat protein
MSVRLRILLAALVLAAVAWTTREIPGFGFLPLVDDDVNIAFNPHLGAPDAARLHWMFTDFSYVHRYMPLGWFGFAAAYAFSGLDPVGYHVAGILLHAANALLVFAILCRLLARFSAGLGERDQGLLAAAAALLWALHPLRVETTSWSSGLLYAQAGFFALLYAWAHLGEREAQSAGRLGRSRRLFALGWASFAASVLTYPVVLFLPFALAGLDWAWIRGPGARRGAFSPALGARAACVGAPAGPGLGLTVFARGTVVQSWGRTPTLAEFGIVARALQAAYVAAVYLLRTVWPADLRWLPLTLFDPDSPGALGWAAVGVLALVSLAAWRLRRTAPFLGVCWIAYLVLIIPNLGLTEHPHTIADRYLYITGVVFAAALALALARLPGPGLRAAALTACAVLAALWSAASVREARVWSDTEAFQQHILSNPDPDLRHITLARMGKLRFMEGDVKGGRAAVKRELDLAPSIGGVYLTWTQVQPAGFLSPRVAESRLQEWPGAPFAVADLEVARRQLQEGRVGDALRHLDSALIRSPRFIEARVRRGLLLAALGRPDEALHDWLYVEWPRESAPRAEVDFMSNYLEQQFGAHGNAQALRFLKLERSRPGR